LFIIDLASRLSHGHMTGVRLASRPLDHNDHIVSIERISNHRETSRLILPTKILNGQKARNIHAQDANISEGGKDAHGDDIIAFMSRLVENRIIPSESKMDLLMA